MEAEIALLFEMFVGFDGAFLMILMVSDSSDEIG
jgi:hypothetical protein